MKRRAVIGLATAAVVVAFGVGVFALTNGESEATEGKRVPWRILGTTSDRSAVIVMPEAALTDCDWVKAAVSGTGGGELQIRVRVVVETCPGGGEILAAVPVSPLLVPLPRGQLMKGAAISGPGYRGVGRMPPGQLPRFRTANVVGLPKQIALDVLAANRTRGIVTGAGAYVTRQDPLGALPGAVPERVRIFLDS